MTSAGVAGVPPTDAGAASGLVNTAHQLGSSLGLATLVTLASQHAGSGRLGVAGEVHAALTGSSAFLALGLVLTLVFIVPRRSAGLRHGPTTTLRTAAPEAAGVGGCTGSRPSDAT